jgi:hypothetical protein
VKVAVRAAAAAAVAPAGGAAELHGAAVAGMVKLAVRAAAVAGAGVAAVPAGVVAAGIHLHAVMQQAGGLQSAPADNTLTSIID